MIQAGRCIFRPQNALLTILVLTGLEGVMTLALVVRVGKWR